jgi:nicotinamide riboside kinase
MATEPTAENRTRTLCLTGPESTGKTTLAAALAEHLGAVLVAEQAREYLAREYLQGQNGYERSDVLKIARLQMAAEAEARETTDGLIICDTDLLVIQVWWEEKYGTLPDELAQAMRAQTARGYLLLHPDLEWVSDPQRENPLDRDRLFARYEAILAAGDHPYRTLAGRDRERLDRALVAVGELFPELS